MELGEQDLAPGLVESVGGVGDAGDAVAEDGGGLRRVQEVLAMAVRQLLPRLRGVAPGEHEVALAADLWQVLRARLGVAVEGV